jgi:hypothetical protein
MPAGDASIIDRCNALHFSQKVSCLFSARGGTRAAEMATGGTSSTASGVMAMSIEPMHLAQNTSGHTTPVGTASRIDAKPLENLEAAAQKLRDAVHALAQAPAGEKRNEAIRQANRTLIDVHAAMAALPPGVITAAGNESSYKEAMDHLEMAAQRLRDSAHALAREPVGAKRADALKAINKALIDTQQVMLDLPLTRMN